MTDLSFPTRIRTALTALHGLAEADSRLGAERQRARREFFGGEAAAEAVTSGPAEERFREWFLLERDSEVLGAPLREAFAGRFDDAALEDSLAGVFVVERVRRGEADARDLQGETLLEVRAPADALHEGDVLVGRLFAHPDGGHVPSPAAAVFRQGARLAAAFHADLERLDLDRRLQQHELERLLIARPPRPAAAAEPAGRPLEHVEAELEAVLRAGGCDWSIPELSRQLAAAPRLGPALGPMLEQLGFDTVVDLDRARHCLVELWNLHQADQGGREGAAPAPSGDDRRPPAPRPGEALGQQLARTLEEGLAQHDDVEDVFRRLEHMAGIEPEEVEAPEAMDADGEPGDNGGAGLGDLQPLTEEYLWERGEAVAGDAATLRLWLQLQQNAAVQRLDLEQVTALDLLRVLLHSYLAAQPGERATAVRAAFAVLQRFYGWAAETQGYELDAALAGCRGGLLDSVQRLQDAGIALSAPSRGGSPCLMHVENVDDRGFGVRLDSGDGLWVAATGAVTGLLREGDLLLGELHREAGRGALAGLVVALPAGAETLVG